MKEVRFLNLSIKDKQEKKELLSIIENIMDHGIFLNGPEIEQFEKDISNYCSRKYCVGVGSGSDALFLALKALGIKEGDEVITTSLSWIATANAIVRVGATPVFSDIKDDLNLDPRSVEKLITNKTKAIIFVNYTGQICDVEEILVIASKNNLLTIEDAAQSFGAKYGSKVAGSFGDISCFSMNPMKLFNSFGEAGAIVTDNEKLKNKVIELKQNGMINRQICNEVGTNSRLDTIQAAVLSYRLTKVQSKITRRREIAHMYNRLLQDIVDIPKEKEGYTHSYYTYTIQVEKRDELKLYLEKNGVQTQIQHDLLMPQQPRFEQYKADINNAKMIVKKILCIPASESNTNEDVQYISNLIREFYE